MHKISRILAGAAAWSGIAANAAWAEVFPILAQGGITSRTVPTKSYIVDGLILAVFVGLALFAVCRSSNRQ